MSWSVVAGTEARLLVRDKLAATMGIVTPLVFGAVFYLLYGRGTGGTGGAELAATQLVMVLGFTVYATATMTLVSRRQHLYLKRLRSSPASTGAIVAGLVTPLVALLLVQAALLWGATGAVLGQAPGRWPLLLVAVLLGGLTCVPLAFLTAALTRTYEAAQLTTMPVFFILVAGLVWVVATPPESVTLPMLAVPGGAVAQLARYGWGGPGVPLPEGGLLAAVAPGVLIALALAAVAWWLAARQFRWEPRR